MKEEVLRTILEENYDRVFRLCLRYFGNIAEAEDATQDVLIKAWNSHDNFRGEAAISTWIYRIAVNVCISSLRGRKFEILKPEIAEESETDEDDQEENNRKETDEKKLEFFREYMERLSPGDRTIVTLYLEDIDSKTIAEIIGLSDTNVRTRIHRIKNAIKTEWEAKYGTR